MAAAAASGGRHLPRNLACLGMLLAVLAGVHFIIVANPALAKSVSQAAVFQWWFLAIVAAAALFGTVALSFTALPGMWDATIPASRKLVVPTIAGGLIGVLYCIGDGATGFSALVAARMHLSTIHIGEPMALPIYVGGAILVSMLYFLTLLPPVHLFVSRFLLRGRGIETVYWIAALPLVLLEPVTQGDFSSVAISGWTAAPNLAGDIFQNFAQAWFLRRAGFIACVAVRVGFYAVWHILYPLL